MQEPNQAKPKRLTHADWQAVFDEWKSSGMKQQEFFNTKGIKLPTFSYWRTRLVGKKKKSSSFQAVNVKLSGKAQSVNQLLNLRLPNGISLTIPAATDKGFLKNLFELLGIAVC